MAIVSDCEGNTLEDPGEIETLNPSTAQERSEKW